MERFKEVIENHDKYAKDWKAKTGRKVLGYLCTYFLVIREGVDKSVNREIINISKYLR